MIKGVIGSWWVFVALLLPPIVLVLFVTTALHSPVSYVIDAKAFRIYYLLILIFLLLKSILYLRAKRLIPAALCFIPSGIMIFGAYLYESRFSAYTIIGEGEALTEYYDLQKGAFARPSILPLRIKKIENDRCTLSIDNKDYELAEGGSMRWKNYMITIEDIERGFHVQLKDANKNLLDEVHVRLNMKGKKKDYFMFPLIPHRFYLSYITKERDYWKQEGKEWRRVKEERKDKDPSKRLHLLILRGKLTVLDLDINEGEDIPFEGRYINLRTDTPFAILKIGTLPIF